MTAFSFCAASHPIAPEDDCDYAEEIDLDVIEDADDIPLHLCGQNANLRHNEHVCICDFRWTA